MTNEQDICEVRTEQGWAKLHVAIALDMPFKPALRCPECHGPVRAHKRGTNGMRAHFEHLTLHEGCSLGSNFDGRKRPHPDALR
jgi:hypothetical protein